MSLLETFRYHSLVLSAKSSALEVVHHAGDRGGEREHLLNDFLSPLLPEKLKIGQGEIRATNGEWSKQEDLIIYDRLNCPRLFVGSRTQVFPAESVAAIIEVKTRLGTQQIQDATKNIKFARKLNKSGMATQIGAGSISFGTPTPIFGVLFAYDLDLSLETFRERWSESQGILSPDERINLVCVLGKFVMIHVDTTFHLWDEGDQTLLGRMVPFDSGEDSLFVFTVALLRVLSEVRFGVPDMFKYYVGKDRLEMPFLFKE